MDRTQQLAYTELVLEAELYPVLRPLFFSEDSWENEMLAKTDVDPLKVHKPYGLVVPQLVKGEWMIGVSVEHFVKPVQEEDDSYLPRWIEYWAQHLFLHVIIAGMAVATETPLMHAEIEAQVDDELETANPGLYSFGGQIRMLNPS